MQTRDRKGIQSDTQSDNRACEISTLALADKLLGSAPEYRIPSAIQIRVDQLYIFLRNFFATPGKMCQMMK